MHCWVVCTLFLSNGAEQLTKLVASHLLQMPTHPAMRQELFTNEAWPGRRHNASGGGVRPLLTNNSINLRLHAIDGSMLTMTFCSLRARHVRAICRVTGTGLSSKQHTSRNCCALAGNCVAYRDRKMSSISIMHCRSSCLSHCQKNDRPTG